MRALGCFFAVLLAGSPGCTWSGGPGPVPAQRAAAPVRPRVVADPHAAPRLVVLARAGSAFDPPGREGLAALSALHIAGAAGAAVTVGPEIVRWEVAPAQATALAAALVSAPPAEAGLAAARAALRAGLSAEPAFAEEAAPVLRYAGHPYGHRPLGRLGVLDTLGAPEVAAFRVRVHRRGAAGLLATGPVLAPAAEALAAALSSWSPAIPQPATPRLLVLPPRPTALVLTGGPATGLRVLAGTGATAAPALAAERVAAASLGLTGPVIPVRQGWWTGAVDPPTPSSIPVAQARVRAACATEGPAERAERDLGAALIGVATETEICAAVATVGAPAVEAARAALTAAPALFLRGEAAGDGPALATDAAPRVAWADLSR